MALQTPAREKTKLTEWVAGGRYVVAVEIEATIFPERPGEPFLTPQTVRFLEQVARDARSAGYLEALTKIGKVFVQLDGPGMKPCDLSSGSVAVLAGYRADRRVAWKG